VFLRIFADRGEHQILLSKKDAPGYRERAGGGLSYVGKGGYNWASTVSGTNGMHLNFNVTWFGPSNADSHGYGFQLRCLSE